MTRVTAILTKKVVLDVDAEDDSAATTLTLDALTKEYPGHSIDIQSFETLETAAS